MTLAALLAVTAAPIRTTGYCGGPCPRCGTRGITRSGKRATGPGVAVPARDWRRLRGRRLVVRGYAGNRPVTVDDSGGGVRPGSIDLRWRTHAAALRWARRTGNRARVRWLREKRR